MTLTWQPTATLETLQQRAAIWRTIRDFFAERGVVEVETPALARAMVPDIHLNSFELDVPVAGCAEPVRCALQTSPEYHMKRLLAAGSGDIYQISKAFRAEEQGRLHNPEFSLLEWYRIGYDHHALMDDVDALLQTVLASEPAERISYQALFETYLDCNPHHSTAEALQRIMQQQGLQVHAETIDRDDCLALLMGHCIEPHLGQARPTMIYDYPATQAALARIQPGEPAVASRFEVYVKGMELANGFHELADATEQRARFEAARQQRRSRQLPVPDLDEHFLAALSHGLPDCAGVALGLDRLIMCALDLTHLSQGMSFSIDNA